MPRWFNRIGLALILLVAGNAWALGLGDIKLESALNQPLRAEIELLSATPDELANLTVSLASPETFERYGLDRPAYLQGIDFRIISTANGAYVRVSSQAPMAEPFLTFLVEASWSRGRLLREYTVLLDPPTFAPPEPTREAVTAPQRSTTRDAGRIERPAAQTPAPRTTPRPAPAVRQEPPAQEQPVRAESQPEPAPVIDTTPYNTASGDDYVVARNETLWGIARATRPDSRLTMNQTMLAIYEANPEAFGGNINMLKAGARLRIPSADDIFQIDRGDALSEVSRQHDSWDGSSGGTVSEPDLYEPELVVEDTAPSLVLVPPDEDTVGIGTGTDDATGTEPLTREQEILDRLEQLEAEEVPEQQSLINVRNNELATLREELARIRGEEYVPPLTDDSAVEDPFAVDDGGEPATEDPLVDDAATDASDDAMADDAATDDAATDDAVAEPEPAPTNVIRSQPEPSLVDQALGLLSNIYVLAAGGVLLIGGFLFWFFRNRSGDGDDSGVWEALDADEEPVFADDETAQTTQTESIPVPDQEDGAFVVVEEDSGLMQATEDTVEVPMENLGGMDDETLESVAVDETIEEEGNFASLEDTFSSETAVNLDQSDPIAEADFHMAYGLYDQAADLVNGALEVEPERQDLLTKLCEIYFVWGNRDAFVDSAEKMKAASAGSDSAEWDKIVIMGQQIASDHELFAGAGVAGATKEVDLAFDDSSEAGGDLDMVFGAEDGESAQAGDDESLDFLFDDAAENAGDVEDLDITAQTPTIESSMTDETVEMAAPDAEDTVETPTVESALEDADGTVALPSVDDAIDEVLEENNLASDETAEIDLDDLGLDLDGLDETAEADFSGLDGDDEMEITGTHDALEDTGVNEALPDIADETGKNPEVDPSATGLMESIDVDSLDATGTNQTIEAPLDDETDVDVEVDMLAATGKTQVLSEDMAVETINEPAVELDGEAETMLASLDEDEEPETLVASLDDDDATMLAPSPSDDDFDFAKTEALPPEVFTGDPDIDATGEMPAVASTDMDLDLDDLTAALQVSEGGDTVEMPRDDETVEQPRPALDDATAEVPTMSFSDDDMSGDLAEARTMTEVGTKLDLARAYVDMGDPGGARSILEEVLDEGDDDQRQQAQQLLDSLPS